MTENNYRPEGMLINTLENRDALSSLGGLEKAMASGRILEARVVLCDNEFNLILDIPGTRAVIPRCDIKIKCILCGREVTVPRVKLEKSIKRISEKET